MKKLLNFFRSPTEDPKQNQDRYDSYVYEVGDYIAEYTENGTEPFTELYFYFGGFLSSDTISIIMYITNHPAPYYFSVYPGQIIKLPLCPLYFQIEELSEQENYITMKEILRTEEAN